ncbi:MAG: HEXXH motif domain-containing protein [Pseudonocardiales bacterium]|nr:MAG: HEXXH motif domain-containing protein [Pseudonocardiales bacterium]
MAMNVSSYRLPDDVFSALAAGGGGVRAVRHLAVAQYSKHVLLLRGVVDAAETLGHPQAAHARRAYDLLATIQERAPGDVDAVIRHPAVGAWAWRTLRALHGEAAIAGAEPGRFAALAAAAAIRSRTPCTLDVPVTHGAISFPSLGMATLPGRDSPAVLQCAADGAAVFTTGGRVDVPRDPSESGPGWRPLPRIVAEASEMTIRLLIDDLDPFRMPASANTAPRLTAEDIDWWRESLSEAWTLLVRYHPVAAEEIAATIRVLTPLTSPPNSQVGASSRETFGTVALSGPPDARSIALTLCHEVQHAKLGAVIDIVALTRPDDGRRWYAPWRDDRRPIGGLLQGSYAFLGVSSFWHRQRWHEDGAAALTAHSEFFRWRAAAQLAVASLLSGGQLTPTGEQFVAGMARTLRGWEGEPVPPEARMIAQQDAEQHLASWRLRNGDSATPSEREHGG